MKTSSSPLFSISSLLFRLRHGLHQSCLETCHHHPKQWHPGKKKAAKVTCNVFTPESLLKALWSSKGDHRQITNANGAFIVLNFSNGCSSPLCQRFLSIISPDITGGYLAATFLLAEKIDLFSASGCQIVIVPADITVANVLPTKKNSNTILVAPLVLQRNRFNVADFDK